MWLSHRTLLSYLAFILLILEIGYVEGQSRRLRRRQVYRNRKTGSVQIARQPGYGRSSNPCDQRSCYPATGNLLVGREERLSSTSTCGLRSKEKFCIVSHLKYRTKKCFWCDSKQAFIGNPRFSHRIRNIVRRIDPRTQRRSWWQSENGKEEVSIRLDLEAEFHFTHLVITFRTFRPKAMLIERSFDNGETWKPYRYFAQDCASAFPGVQRTHPVTISDVVCESRYSEVEPSTEGEVILRVLPRTVVIKDPYSDEVQNVLKITNLRVNFTKMHTLGDQLLDTRSEIKEKYYYAIYDMIVRGSCSCYGHASRCLPIHGVPDLPDMVHGKCECTHNTVGFNCKQCRDFFNDLPWKPAIGKEKNACKRCNCYEHATRCHFDENVYEATGRVSGGVCDECQHNTMGRMCQDCIPNFYQEPSKDLRDPEICQPCHCDTRGSIDDAICDSKTDQKVGLIAGRCHCKQYADGMKCDRCKAGYWNFTAVNPVGCQECSCDLLGTLGNLGCDQYSGTCQCKINVIGRDCNQCRPQHYGLSDEETGCKPCQCDKGGAVDNDCDVLSGQCKCRPHVVGRQCDTPEEGYFVPYLNYLTYEAELARGDENCQVVMREPHPDGRETTWTGIGFMRVFDGSRLEFEIENIETSMEYDTLIKYEPGKFRGDWEGITMRIERPSPVDPNGPCANSRHIDDSRRISLADHSREKMVFPTVCLESGKRYTIILEFSRTNAQTDSRGASILIDSISLIPRTDSLPFYSGSPEADNHRRDFDHHRCSEPFYTSGHDTETIPERCLDEHLDSIGFYVFGQAYSCQCDGTGSYSSICSSSGGQCHCKPNVQGRRCDRCAPGTYGFGPEGCLACDCSNLGVLDNFCDQQTGKCKCKPNTYGRQCDECQPGFWNFPNCVRCECNGHADTCESETGECHECRDHTTGRDCSMCKESYYGDPRLEVGIPCRQCPCPGTALSDHSFASRCQLDPNTKDVVCECQEGYAGFRCDVCADNFYGNPEHPGGMCHPCECNKNIDPSRPGNCHAKSGECLQCIRNTAGDNCERCEDGYFGDAINGVCRECECNLLGINRTIGGCNHFNGQCPCLPNVLGVQCDKCERNHWKLASGKGCEHCNCDPKGSYTEQCNQYDGVCQCRSGFGGRQCNQCQENFYGDPKVECIPCDCSRDGSRTMQCDHETGQCECNEGIGGAKCDKCARGFNGRAPYCQTCGECFDNWDLVLDDLKERTKAMIESASQIKQRGATGAYSYEFESMEEKLADVRTILLNANMTSENLHELENLITELSAELNEKEKQVMSLEQNVDNTTQRISLASNSLADLRLQADELKNQAGDLKDKATKLQEANVEGALNLTRVAGQRSRDAQVRVEFTEVLVGESERYRKQAHNILTYRGDRFNRTIEMNADAIDQLTATIEGMENHLPELNHQVCDRRGDPCDSFCGGAGCGKCGGLSCNNGLVNTADLALKFAADTEIALKRKEASADELLRGITLAKTHSDSAYEIAKLVAEMAMNAQNQTQERENTVQRLLEEIEEYFTSQAAKPSEIRDLADLILQLDIKLRPEQITELAEKITLTIRSLTDIDTIIDATRNDLATANALKERADYAKMRAEGTLEVAEKVVVALNESDAAQIAAETAISEATDDISATEVYLMEIAKETSSAQSQTNSSQREVGRLSERVDKVQGEFRANQQHLEDTTRAVEQASLTSQRATNEAKGLEDKYKYIEEQLETKSLKAEQARKRADELKKRANKLSAEAYAKLELLKDLKADFETNEERLLSYDEEISSLEIRMSEYHEYILRKSTIYTTCTADKSRTKRDVDGNLLLEDDESLLSLYDK